ncbi:MAG: hypothetical protein EX272_12485 [Chromatiales bacterium]|nr:MAG: hypothetical protein EX272_12485 [Chromatiales bacterium]
MPMRRFPELDSDEIGVTRDALHAYSKVLGDWLKTVRSKRKHWWHASLRLSVRGLTTGVVRAATDFEVELDLIASRLRVRTAPMNLDLELRGQPAADVASWLHDTLSDVGVDSGHAPTEPEEGSAGFPGYVPVQAQRLHEAFAAVAGELESFRAGIREETSPVQVWPHHFDLSMIWLPGPRIEGQDPANEEYADKQMNFGFVFGDDSIAVPYLYITAYPLPDVLPTIALPTGTAWKSDGFNGAVLLYDDLVAKPDPSVYLQDLWARLLEEGRGHFLETG